MTKPVVTYDDLTITWGMPFRLPFTWETSDGSLVDLSWVDSARCEIRPKAGDSHLIVAFDTTPGEGEGLIEIGSEAENTKGQIVLTLDEPLTWSVLRGGEWDLFLYHADGSDLPPVKFGAGKATLDKSVTHRRPA